jgi:hypothetical protein
MSELFNFAKQEDPRSQSLLTAARTALEANPTPRIIHFIIGPDGTPIEKVQVPDPNQLQE